MLISTVVLSGMRWRSVVEGSGEYRRWEDNFVFFTIRWHCLVAKQNYMHFALHLTVHFQYHLRVCGVVDSSLLEVAFLRTGREVYLKSVDLLLK